MSSRDVSTTVWKLQRCYTAGVLRPFAGSAAPSVSGAPHLPVSPAAPVLQPPSLLQLRWGPSLLLGWPGAHLAVHLCCAGSLESSSVRHLPCSAIHPSSSHWGLLRTPQAKMQLLSTLKSTLCFCLFKFYICFPFPFYWSHPLKCKCQDA